MSSEQDDTTYEDVKPQQAETDPIIGENAENNPISKPRSNEEARAEQEQKKAGLELVALEERLEREKEDQESRLFLRTRILHLTYIYLTVVGCMVVLNGAYQTQFLWIKLCWHISDQVMITVLSTTTVTIVGLFLAVTKHYFNGDKKGDNPK